MVDADVWNVCPLQSDDRRSAAQRNKRMHDYIHTVTVTPLVLCCCSSRSRCQSPHRRRFPHNGPSRRLLRAVPALTRSRRCLDQHDTDRVRRPALIAAPGRTPLIGTAARRRRIGSRLSGSVRWSRRMLGLYLVGPFPNRDSWRVEPAPGCCVSCLWSLTVGELIAPPWGYSTTIPSATGMNYLA